ncbi:hypothetical protein VC218_19710 [Xanthomonas nasturtii]|uniref:hypothetical protein n=1 Tax=Xanthomonas nasturtii TaxID=1843581 RepID=UPI002B23C914|nr:hypothetical protein [Xanthomonas nasturtii]MEA9581039.1 hypothetical protein [Xanthomonas nasturtii]
MCIKGDGNVHRSITSRTPKQTHGQEKKISLLTMTCLASTVFSTAICLAQPPDGAPEAAAIVDHPAASVALVPGEYITEKGWGHLRLTRYKQSLRFSLESTNGQAMCFLEGVIDGSQGIATSEMGPTDCKVQFAGNAEGIDVTTTTPVECKSLCGYNGGFEAPTCGPLTAAAATP